MLTVTESAAQELRGFLATNATDPNQVLRLDPAGDGFGLGIGWQVEGDEVMESGGAAILHVSSELAAALACANIVIDCGDTPEGPCLNVYNAVECQPGVCDCGCQCHDDQE